MPRLAPLVVVVTSCALVSLATRDAHARDGEQVRLHVTRGEGAEACPDDRAVADAVAARLGHEPFGDEASHLVDIRFARDGDGVLEAVVRLLDGDGVVRGDKTLTSSRGDCEELASTTTLTVSILLDPRSGLVPPVPPPRVETPDPAPPVTAPKEAPSPAVAPEVDLRLRLTLAAIGSLGTAPSPAAGVLVGVGVERRWWTVGTELRVDAPATGDRRGLRARTSFTGGNVVPCARVSAAYACGVLTLGAIGGEIEGGSPSRRSTFHAMIGPRVGIALPLTRTLALDGHVDGAYALTSTTLRAGAADLWSTAAVSGLVAIGLLGRFP